jgi:type II secretory pathway pseudopilin PulG
MRNKRRQLGVTLVEMMVVVGIAALMVGLTIPAANMLLNSFESESGAKSIISSALASARAIAAKEQRYAGIRFQKRYDPANPDPLNCSQYIIFIIKGENRFVTNNITNGFRAVKGIQPIKLPDSIGVMDLYVNGVLISTNAQIDVPAEVNDITAFSIVFSPSGKLVNHGVRVRNRDGDTAGTEIATRSRDDVFNTLGKITSPVNPVGMFLQDDYPFLGLGEEMSRNSFVIYDTKKFRQAYNTGTAYSGYLSQLKPIYINPYTGTIITQ